MTRAGCFDVRPRFSPDGTRLANGVSGYNPPRVGIRNLETGAVRTLKIDSLDLAWSPGGRRLAVAGYDLFVYNLQGRLVRELSGQDAEEVDWSRQNRLAWDSGPRKDLLVSGPSFADIQRFPVVGDGPRWSPDGQRILFECDEGACVINADGTDRKVLSRRCENTESGRAWAPDGKQIACIDGDSSALVTIDIRTGKRRIVKRGQFSGELDWQARPK